MRHTVASFERAPLHSISAMLRRLNAFYESHGISPVGFRCPSLAACSADSPDFTTAKASFVGQTQDPFCARAPGRDMDILKLARPLPLPSSAP